MTKFKRVDPRKCLRLAVEAENSRGAYGKVSAIIYKWSQRHGRCERVVWRWLELGRFLIVSKKSVT